jgi:hypothetical protein
MRRGYAQETREELLERILNPSVSTYEAAKILEVPEETVRELRLTGALVPSVCVHRGDSYYSLDSVLSLLNDDLKYVPKGDTDGRGTDIS